MSHDNNKQYLGQRSGFSAPDFRRITGTSYQVILAADSIPRTTGTHGDAQLYGCVMRYVVMTRVTKCLIDQVTMQMLAQLGHCELLPMME